MDCAPALGAAGAGRKTIIVAVDDFSKYTLLGILDSHTPAAVVEWLGNTIISIFGVPCRLRVDNGTEFRGELEVLCKLLEIELRRIKPHCPW